MRRVLVLGAGKIGTKIAHYLQNARSFSDYDYDVRIADISQDALDQVDRAGACPNIDRVLITDEINSLKEAMFDRDAVISALYHTENPKVALLAARNGLSYFDLTEDVKSTAKIIRIGDCDYTRKGQVFMPQCGLAPGFVSIVAGELASQLDEVDSIHMRVGALPQFPENKLKYNLTWSTDGLINEYCNPCDAIVAGEPTKVQALDGVERLLIEGVEYEAFNTSGGLGSVCDTIGRGVREINYKTLRYPGHRDLMHFLLHDCNFINKRDELKQLLESTIPFTGQDVVIIFCSATGYKNNRFVKVSDIRQIRSQSEWSAIQITTAASVCAVVDLYFEKKIEGTGFYRQENIRLGDFLGNRFGKEYARAA